MKDRETVQEYISKVSEIVTSMRSYDEDISQAIVMRKFLRTLHKEFNPLVTTIEKTKDMTTYTFDELMSSLLAYEDRMNRSTEKVVEKGPFKLEGRVFKN